MSKYQVLTSTWASIPSTSPLPKCRTISKAHFASRLFTYNC